MYYDGLKHKIRLTAYPSEKTMDICINNECYWRFNEDFGKTNDLIGSIRSHVNGDELNKFVSNADSVSFKYLGFC